MSEIIFCKTRFQGQWNEQARRFEGGYASYGDLWHMVEWAGYPIIYVDQLDPQSDNTYIVTPLNGEWVNGWNKPRARIIHWEFEWRTDWRAEVDEPPGVAEVWAMDKWFAERIGARYVPVGGDERLNELGSQYPAEKRFDVALLSYQTGRRQSITQQLNQQGLSLAPTSGLWGRQRSSTLLQSQAMVHVHQTDNMPGVAALRWCLAAAHGLPMITESVKDRGIFSSSYMVESSYDFLAAFASHMLKDKRLLADYASALHQLLCRDYTFKRAVDSHV